jgi:nicotinamidase-related amidase
VAACLIGRRGEACELVPELEPRPNEAVFDKISMSPFVGTPRDIVLRDCGVSAFAIAGVAMEVGIQPTVHHAIDRTAHPGIRRKHRRRGRRQ